MSTHSRAADDIPPAPAAVALPANAADNAPASVGATTAAVRPRTRGSRLTVRNGVVASCVSIAGGSAGWAFGGPVLAIVSVLAVIMVGVMGIAAAVALSALLGRQDPRSPFDRVMLILCVILGRSPSIYLPPTQNGQGAHSGIPAALEIPAVSASTSVTVSTSTPQKIS
jgi:hypothetical protein